VESSHQLIACEARQALSIVVLADQEKKAGAFAHDHVNVDLVTIGEIGLNRSTYV